MEWPPVRHQHGDHTIVVRYYLRGLQPVMSRLKETFHADEIRPIPTDGFTMQLIGLLLREPEANERTRSRWDCNGVIHVEYGRSKNWMSALTLGWVQRATCATTCCEKSETGSRNRVEIPMTA